MVEDDGGRRLEDLLGDLKGVQTALVPDLLPGPVQFRVGGAKSRPAKPIVPPEQLISPGG